MLEGYYSIVHCNTFMTKFRAHKYKWWNKNQLLIIFIKTHYNIIELEHKVDTLASSIMFVSALVFHYSGHSKSMFLFCDESLYKIGPTVISQPQSEIRTRHRLLLAMLMMSLWFCAHYELSIIL